MMNLKNFYKIMKIKTHDPLKSILPKNFDLKIKKNDFYELISP